MVRAFLVLMGGLFVLGCAQRSICPAFQSAYIHDRDELRKKFSYFQEDSTPKVLTASKNRYLVAEPTPYRKKLRSLQTVQMKPVPVHVPDSLISEDSVSLEALDRAARSVIDSTFIEDVPAQSAQASADDSVYVISKDKELRLLKYNAPDSLIYDPVAEKYVAQQPAYYIENVRLNIDQDNYMWYLRDYLVLPDVRLARIQQGGEKARNGSTKAGKKKEKKGLKGFFKDLFKKKPKADTTELPPPPKEEFDFIDTDSATQSRAPAIQPETRKGFFASRKNKSNAAATEPDSPPADSNKKPVGDEAIREDEQRPVIEGF